MSNVSAKAEEVWPLHALPRSYYMQEPRRPPYQAWRPPSARLHAEDGRNAQLSPTTAAPTSLNFLDLNDHDTPAAPAAAAAAEPPDRLDAAERGEKGPTISPWHAHNQQPWRHAIRRVSARVAARSDHRLPPADHDAADTPAPGMDPKDLGLRELRTQAMRYSKALKQKKRHVAREGTLPTPSSTHDPTTSEKSPEHDISRFATELYTVSYLIFFAILGTLARIGLEALTFYPGAPVVFGELWANFGGCVFMGFLLEDNQLFREEWGKPRAGTESTRADERPGGNPEAGDAGGPGPLRAPVDEVAAKKAHGATKKTIPLYIGLATGFCGSFTTFGSFMRDCFLALSNDLPSPLNHPADHTAAHASVASTVPRNAGYSLLAVTAVILTTVALCISGFVLGTHLAELLHPHTPTLPFRLTRRILDPLAVLLGWGSWLGAILMTIRPPDSPTQAARSTWRSQALLPAVLGPLGCLLRFYASRLLNPKIPAFPLGTFVVNVAGTMILGISWDVQHVPSGGPVACQVLQGIEAGFCGCLTTVSTWVAEFCSLTRRHAYRYAILNVLVSLASLVAIMGALRWTRGFAEVTCATA